MQKSSICYKYPDPGQPNELPTKFKTETPDESPKDSATELQSASESEPSWMSPASQPVVPNFPTEEPSSAPPTDPTTELQSATKSGPSLIPTELPKFPNEPSQRAPSSEPSKSSVRKEPGHRRTSPPKQPSKLRSKIILDRPNCFGRVQINLVRSKSFWPGSN